MEPHFSVPSTQLNQMMVQVVATPSSSSSTSSSSTSSPIIIQQQGPGLMQPSSQLQPPRSKSPISNTDNGWMPSTPPNSNLFANNSPGKMVATNRGNRMATIDSSLVLNGGNGGKGKSSRVNSFYILDCLANPFFHIRIHYPTE